MTSSMFLAMKKAGLVEEKEVSSIPTGMDHEKNAIQNLATYVPNEADIAEFLQLKPNTDVVIDKSVRCVSINTASLLNNLLFDFNLGIDGYVSSKQSVFTLKNFTRVFGIAQERLAGRLRLVLKPSQFKDYVNAIILVID